MSAPEARAAPWRRPRCMGDKEDQLMVVRGVCANQKSARSRSPASNCDCEIIASPLRFLRRRSHGDRAFVGVKADIGARPHAPRLCSCGHAASTGWMERREGAGRERWHGPLEEIGGAIENGIITAALDDAAGMRDRRAIALEEPSRLGERQSAADAQGTWRPGTPVPPLPFRVKSAADPGRRCRTPE
jgi:hypothetical protein